MRPTLRRTIIGLAGAVALAALGGLSASTAGPTASGGATPTRPSAIAILSLPRRSFPHDFRPNRARAQR